ncbi:MAG: hypothetical protein HC838_05015 [Spirulinaceae cyanobacterium RM2_2_10]|nr:hypothetical protein [Spirulinaceae cyanobacterium RM2_2_10]
MPASNLPLHCPDRDCQAANPSDRRFCQQCNTPLMRRYLWAIGEGIEHYPRDAAVADRYLHWRSRLFLDTKPAQPPQFPKDIPTRLVPYLRLFYLRPHVPQLYGQLPPSPEAPTARIWLLECGLFSRDRRFLDGSLWPTLVSAWPEASPLRQLNWLWQMARLWPDLAKHGVASTLLTPEFLQVDQGTLQLRELRLDDPESPPELAQLGTLWSAWLMASAPNLRNFLKPLCQELSAGRLETSQDLVALLDRALAICGRHQTRQYDIMACTDTGRVRQHNEDACYPDSGQVIAKASQALTIVCDGIGGHEGGRSPRNWRSLPCARDCNRW